MKMTQSRFNLVPRQQSSIPYEFESFEDLNPFPTKYLLLLTGYTYVQLYWIATLQYNNISFVRLFVHLFTFSIIQIIWQKIYIYINFEHITIQLITCYNKASQNLRFNEGYNWKIKYYHKLWICNKTKKNIYK